MNVDIIKWGKNVAPFIYQIKDLYTFHQSSHLLIKITSFLYFLKLINKKNLKKRIEKKILKNLAPFIFRLKI